MKVLWIGKSGFTPGIGTTIHGKPVDIPNAMLKSLEGRYETLDKKTTTGDKK